MRLTLVASVALALLAACGTRPLTEAEPTASTNGDAAAGARSFLERADRIVRERGFARLQRPRPPERKNARPRRELLDKVRKSLARHHEDAEVLHATLAIFMSTSERLGPRKELMWVTHTGPFPTGDCLDFYDAETLHYDVGSCFLGPNEL